MNKFYEIAIDYYLPLSHDNNYLFNHYDRITNFLTFNIDQQYRNLLAKPIKSGYNLEWFSIYPNLINAQDSQYEDKVVKYFFQKNDLYNCSLNIAKILRNKFQYIRFHVI